MTIMPLRAMSWYLGTPAPVLMISKSILPTRPMKLENARATMMWLRGGKYRPSGQIMWVLVDGFGQGEINLKIGSDVFDLLA
ncbi:hypothetical protein DL239_11985 [Sedimentitalea sp. CY04]|uniref:Uncharacterized protein n=2 Tax=Parasedimentitalea denitrificans TaxID=2211118 RepID=A0ABX0WAL8_9RHOB|nr:hypothetical protein [Sedimentitalea sp. CY04]